MFRRTVWRGVSRALELALALSMTVLLAAHVGSPDVFWTGSAGPYPVDVVIHAPRVVPGIAEILVHTTAPGVERVTVRPVYWRAGSKGAPSADEAKPVAGAPGSYAGRLWLIATGSYSVHVTVSGGAGQGTAVVPVAAVATGQLALSPGLKGLLGVLGALLVAGVVTAVYAAAGESQVPPGESIAPPRRRHARIVASVGAAVVALLVLGGARWWRAEATAYARTLYRPMHTTSSLRDSLGVPVLTLRVVDTLWREDRQPPLMPDHGKLVHLALVRIDSVGVLAHLHPSMPDFATMRTVLPPLPAGRYRVFADVVHETGFERTLVDSLRLAQPTAATGVARLDPDDAWFLGPVAHVTRAGATSHVGDDVSVGWLGPPMPIAGRTGVLRFSLRRSSGDAVIVQPYLGMAGHAFVQRRDGGVYVHLHPSGSSTMASALAFALRDRGDTTPDGRLRVRDVPMAMPAPAPEARREIDFPYAFPSGGAYRVWVQLRVRDTVRTAAFDVDVLPARLH
jgi:hypothetical protein